MRSSRSQKAKAQEVYWKIGLLQQMNSAVASSPSFNVFLASQVKMKDKGFLSRDILIHDLITHKGDVHHLFPREYLKKNGLNKGMYNQIANYVLAQNEINIAIGAKSPQQYFGEIFEQIHSGKLKYGGITSMDELKANLEMNCIPTDIFSMNAQDYNNFLEKRRSLMA